MTNFSRNYFQNITSFTTADPAVFTLADHGLIDGDRIRFETTVTMPTGLAVKTDYWVVYNGLGTGVFQISSSDGGTPLAITASGSGTLSFIKSNRASLSPAYQNNR